MSNTGETTAFEDENAGLVLTRNIPEGWLRLVENESETVFATFFTRSDSALDSDEETDELALLSPENFKAPLKSVLCAAIQMTKLLETFAAAPQGQSPSFRFAISGGLAIKVLTRDPRRLTDDVDISFDGDMRSLFLNLLTCEALDGGRFNRFVLPESRLFVSAFRMYVKVGPLFGDEIEEDHHIKVEFLTDIGPPLRGSLAWPRNVERRRVRLADHEHELPIVDVMPMLASKLKAYNMRDAFKDFEDICLLLDLEEYQTVIEQERGSLNTNEIINFLDYRPPNMPPNKDHEFTLLGYEREG